MEKFSVLGTSGSQHPGAKDHQTLTCEDCGTKQDLDVISFTPSFPATLKTALKSCKGDKHCWVWDKMFWNRPAKSRSFLLAHTLAGRLTVGSIESTVIKKKFSKILVITKKRHHLPWISFQLQYCLGLEKLQSRCIEGVTGLKIQILVTAHRLADGWWRRSPSTAGDSRTPSPFL